MSVKLGEERSEGRSHFFLPLSSHALSHTLNHFCVLCISLCRLKKKKNTCSLNQNHIRKQLTITSVRVGDFLTCLKPCPIINLSMGTFIKERIV